MYQGCIPKKSKNRRPIDEIGPKKQKMYLVPRYAMVRRTTVENLPRTASLAGFCSAIC